MSSNMIDTLANAFSIPISSKLLFSVRYTENIHLYFWLLKDLAWSLSYTDFGMTFGTIAVLWLGVLFFNAIKARSTEEILFVITMTFWLIGNYLWMTGELENNDDDVYRPQGRYCMIAGMVVVSCYHIFVKWFGWITLTPNEKAEELYNETGLKSRFSYFTTFRQYEQFHIFCWLGKDLCWNADIKALWCIFVLPTFFISADFIFLTSKNPRMIIDLAHYCAQFLWVSANICWAYGELYEVNFNDRPQYLFKPNDRTFRWASSLLLFLAWIPLIMLYCVWLPLTIAGKIKTPEPIPQTGDIEMSSETYQHPDIAKQFPKHNKNDFGDDDVEL